MKTPYFVTNKNEYEKILKPLLLEWGYHEELNKNCDYTIIVLNDCSILGTICNYTHLEQINLYDRYLEPNIHQFLKVAAELMGKEYKPFLKDTIHCPTEELAKKVLYIADKIGYKWKSNKSFLDFTNWGIYKQETCYYISEGAFGSRNLDKEHNIISAEEFINFYKEYLDMVEKRNVQITLEQAREWYRSENQTLKTLALSAFKEEELQLTAMEIMEKVGCIKTSIIVSPKDIDKITILSYLSLLAKYFNSMSKETSTQYFIKGKYEGEIQFGSHSGVRYPGIVYFNKLEDLNKAVKLIGDEIKYLFQ